MPLRATIAIHPRNSVEAVTGGAMILLCQDAADTFVVMLGGRGDLHALLLWGAKNWFMLPPDETYFRALEDVIEPMLEPANPAETEIVSTSCGRHFVEGSAAPGGIGPMSFVLRFGDRTLLLDDVTDALFFITDEKGEMHQANGGAGWQKGHLLEVGLGMLFGMDALTRFCNLKYSGMLPQARVQIEKMRRQMRNAPDDNDNN